MQETTFYIVENIKTAEGFQSIGKFFVGNSKTSAAAIFHKLKGRSHVDEKTFLTLDLIETKGGLPFNIQMICCTLEELADNCKIITRETFKLFNLDKSQS